MASRGYFSRGRPARRLRSKLAVGHARRAGRARPGGSAHGRFPAWGRGVGRRAAGSSRRAGARSAGGARGRAGGSVKKKDKKTNRTPRNARRGSGRRPRPRGTTATPAVARVGVGAARRSSVARREDEQRTKGTPPKGLGVDGLADGAQQLERRARRGRDWVVAGAHERADRRRRRVEVRDLVLVDDAPEAARVGPRRHPFKHDLGGAVQQGAVGDVGVARDPAAVLRGRVPRRWRWGRGVAQTEAATRAAGRAPSSKRKGKGRRKLTAVQNQTSSARVGASKTVRNEWPAPTM